MVLVDGGKISMFACGHKTFRDGFQFFPTRANLFGLAVSDLLIGGGGGDDMQEIGEFLDDLVGGGDQMMRMWQFIRVGNEKSAGSLADPLGDAVIAGAVDE